MQKKIDAKVISISSIKAACKDCSLRELCLPLGLSEPDISALDKLIKRRRTLKKGEMLYRHGDPLRARFMPFAAARSKPPASLKTAGPR